MVYYRLIGTPWGFQKHFWPNQRDPNLVQNQFFSFLEGQIWPKTGFSSIYVTDTSMGDRCGYFRVVLLPRYFVLMIYFGPVNVKIWIFYPKAVAQIQLSWEMKHYKIPTPITHGGVCCTFWWKTCFLPKFGLLKIEKWFLTKFGSLWFGPKYFWNPQGVLVNM